MWRLTIGLVVGGSITIPHLRRTYRIWDDLQAGRVVRDRPEKDDDRRADPFPR